MFKKSKGKWLYGMIFICFIFAFMHADHVQAATHNITIYQYLPPIEGIYASAGDTFYEVYPNKTHFDYKKFMKYTYKISDDSVIGIIENANTKEDPAKWISNKVGFVKPYNIEVHSLTPGKATLRVYDKRKMIDKYNFTVVSYLPYSPSSFVNDTYEASSGKISKAKILEQNKLIQKSAKAATDKKYTTTNKRILAAIHATSEYYHKKNKLEDTFFNAAVLNNLGYRSSGYDGINWVEIYQETDRYNDDGEVIGHDGYFDNAIFGESEPSENFDFGTKDVESVYSKTHFPAWIIGEDTPIQIIDVGQTKTLSSCDLNDNLYSSDTSILTVNNGSITGVKPGCAMVYRYNDTYFDAFFVLVKNKGNEKTIKAKIYTKTMKPFFKESDKSIYIEGISDVRSQILNWEKLRMVAALKQNMYSEQ